MKSVAVSVRDMSIWRIYCTVLIEDMAREQREDSCGVAARCLSIAIVY